MVAILACSRRSLLFAPQTAEGARTGSAIVRRRLARQRRGLQGRQREGVVEKGIRKDLYGSLWVNLRACSAPGSS